MADTEILQIHYVPCTHADCVFSPNGPHPHLQNLPVSIPRGLVDALADHKEIDCVERNYMATPNAFLLRMTYVHESDEVTLCKRFGAPYRHLSEAKRRELSEVIDQLPVQVDRPPIFYVTMFNDTKNYFSIASTTSTSLELC